MRTVANAALGAYAAARSRAAIFDRSGESRIEHRGADALDLLHRLTTNDLLSLGEGQARRTVVTTEDARIVDVLTVVRRAGKPLLLLASEGAAGRVLEWLDKFTFAEDSTPVDITEARSQVTLVGNGVLLVLASAGAGLEPELQAGEYRQITIAGGAVEVVRTNSFGLPTIELVCEPSRKKELVEALVDGGGTTGDQESLNALRVAFGVPGWGSEIDGKVNPHEANLLPLIDFEKGCYIGQEVVARLDTYDKVQRRLVAIRGDSPLTAGQGLLADGRKVGDVRTVATPSIVGGHFALAYVRRNHWTAGTRLSTEGGDTVEVVSLPLA